MKRLVNYFWISIVLVQCTEDEKPQLHGPDFFPLAVGKYWIYRVEHTVFSPFQPPAADTFQLMVHVADSFINSEQAVTYVVHRYKRQDENQTWEFISTWSARITDQYVIVNEGNLPIIPLAFPIYVNRMWNANLYNNQPEDEFRITKLTADSSFGPSIGWIAQVVQEDVSNNLTYRDVRMEFYARNVGLLSKVSEVWHYTCTGGTCTDVISSGYKWVQNLEELGWM